MTYKYRLIKQERGLAIYQVFGHMATPERQEHYVVKQAKGAESVRTAIAGDHGCEGERVAALSAEGIMSVASPRTRHAARRWFRRMSCDRSPILYPEVNGK